MKAIGKGRIRWFDKKAKASYMFTRFLSKLGQYNTKTRNNKNLSNKISLGNYNIKGMKIEGWQAKVCKQFGVAVTTSYSGAENAKNVVNTHKCPQERHIGRKILVPSVDTTRSNKIIFDRK